MSKTPRTDEHLRMKEKNGHVAIVSRDFARQLETELADKEKQLAEAWAEIERLKKRRNNMSEYIECPYCGEEQKIDHDDGYGYDEGTIHRQECAGCGKNFAYETTISVYYEAFAAPCIDGDAEHDWKETRTIPRCFRKLRCSVCGEEKEIEGIEEERKAYFAELGKSKGGHRK